ncbi:hypothetical protein ABG067_001837 [Albugo candida]
MQYAISCGEGLQTIKWLGLAVAQRHAQALYHGRYRTRNLSSQQGFYLPLLVSAAVRTLSVHKKLAYHSLQKTGELLAPSLRIADTCKDGDRIIVKLQVEEILIDEIGVPQLNSWIIAAFYHDCIEAQLPQTLGLTSSSALVDDIESMPQDPMKAYTRSEAAIQGLCGRLQSPTGVEAVFTHEWRRIRIDEILEKAGVVLDTNISSKNTSSSVRADNMAKVKEKEKLQSLFSQHFASLNTAYMHYAAGCNESFYGMNGFEFAHFVHECQLCDLGTDLGTLQYLIGVTLTKSADDYGSIHDRTKLSRVGFLHVLIRLLLRDYSKMQTSSSVSVNASHESPGTTGVMSVVTYLENKLTSQVLPTIKRLTSGYLRELTHQKNIVAHFLYARPTLTLLFERLALQTPQPETQSSSDVALSNHPGSWPRLPTAGQIKQLLYDAGIFCFGDSDIHTQLYAECVSAAGNNNLDDQTLVYVEFIEVIVNTALRTLTADQQNFPPKETIRLALQAICRVQCGK